MTTAVVTTLLLVPASAASAQESISEKLFVEGRRLMAEEKLELACAKFKAAYDLDRTATGTLLNLALCHERTKRTASAWAELRQVAAESAGRREDRVALAREHEARLAPALSYVRLVVPPQARLAGLTLVLDDAQTISAASWDTDLPIDPGPHVVHVSAPARAPIDIRVTVGEVADRKTVIIPVLPEAPPPQPVLGADDVARERAAARRQARRVVGYSIGGAGLATLTLGLAFGLSASNQNERAKSLCDENAVCPDATNKEEASRLLADADKTATVANVLSITGGALLVGGAILVLTSLPNSSSSPVALRITPLWGGASLAIGGAL